MLKKGTSESIDQLLEFMDDLNISNEMIKEHLAILILDPKLLD